MTARGNALEAAERGEAFDFEALFHAWYPRTARLIARVIRDPARAEELAVEVFWKLWRHPKAHGEKAGGWLYTTAVRIALNELRRQARASRYETLSEGAAGAATPEEARAAAEEQEHVRTVLAVLDRRQAEVLLLRSSDMSYDEVAAALDVNPASVGSLVSRAQQAFRKEYVKRYGEQEHER